MNIKLKSDFYFYCYSLKIKLVLKKLLTIIIVLNIFSVSELYAGPGFESDTVCVGNPTSFTLTGAAGVTFVRWDFGDLSVTNDTSNNFNPTYSYSNGGIFTVKLIFYIGAIKDSVIQNILVQSIPYPLLPPDYTLCPGIYSLNANFPFGDSYLWSTGATTQGIQYSIPGIYWVQVSNVCGVGIDTFLSTFIYPPSQQLISQSYLCPGNDEDTLIAGPNNPNYYYQWASGQNTNTIIVTQPGNYFVQIYNQCGSITSYCNVYSLLPPEVELGANDTSICGDIYLFFDVFIPSCDYCNYVWSNGETNWYNLINTEGISWVTISNECGIASDTINIDSLPYPNYVFGNDTIICNNEFLTYNLSLEDGEFLWQDGSTSSSYIIDTTGVFYVNQHNLCASLIDTIKVKKLTLSLDFNIGDTLLCRGDTLVLNATQPEGIYHWNTGSTDSIININSEGTYHISVSNYCGLLEDEATIYFENCNSCIHIPTAFSPNQDGHNDQFRVKHDCILTNYEIHIFNRWGQELFSSNNPDAVWDGKYRGEDQPIDVYVYELKYSKSDLINVTSEFLSGNITLLR